MEAKKFNYTFIGMVLSIGTLLMFTTGCATSKQLASNLKGKSLAGNGLISIQKVVLTEPETGTFTPEISSMIISGDFQSILKDANFLRYDRRESSAWYNASCKTVTESLTINLSGDKADMPATVEKVKEYIKAQTELSEKKAESEKTTSSNISTDTTVSK